MSGDSTPSIPSGISPDPLTALIVLVTELRTEVRQALDQIKAHDTELAILRTDLTHTSTEWRAELAQVDKRVAVLETQRTNDSEHQTNRLTSKQVFWGAVGTLAALALVAVTLYSLMKGH